MNGGKEREKKTPEPFNNTLIFSIRDSVKWYMLSFKNTEDQGA